MREEVLKFIDALRSVHKEAMIDVFSNGCCYWFAVILCDRFDGEMYYLEVENHWITKIGDRFYDVTGEVSGDNAERWSEFVLKDEALTKRLYRDCIWKV